jgi:hypothetical protein
MRTKFTAALVAMAFALTACNTVSGTVVNVYSPDVPSKECGQDKFWSIAVDPPGDQAIKTVCVSEDEASKYAPGDTYP